MAIFGPTPWVNLFLKISIFRLFQLLIFFSLENRVFVLEYHKIHFPTLYCLQKKIGKMAIFRSNPWVNHIEKMTIYRIYKLFELFFFIA